jgi:hypothetical protein
MYLSQSSYWAINCGYRRAILGFHIRFHEHGRSVRRGGHVVLTPYIAQQFGWTASFLWRRLCPWLVLCLAVGKSRPARGAGPNSL